MAVRDDGSDLTTAQMRALLAASKVLNSTLDLDEVLERVTRTACSLVSSERATVYVIDEKAGALWTRAMAGPRIETFRIPLGKGVVGAVARTGRSSNLRDAYRSPHFHREQDQRTGFRTRALLTVAVRDRNRRVVGVLQAINHRGRGWFGPREQRALEALADYVALSLENALFVRALQEKRQFEQQLEAARTIQQVLLPKALPSVDGFEIAARYRPCHSIGGDCYDALALPEGRVGVAVGDVSGKGLSAALMMANLVALFRLEARRGGAPEEVLSTMNRLFHESTQDHHFATFFYGVLEPAVGELRYASAGHEPPLRIAEDGTTEDGALGNTLLGIFPETGFVARTLRLEPGSVCVLCSDGITEQNDPDEELFTRERMVQVAVAHRSESAESIATAIVDAVEQFARGAEPSDDLTLMVVRRLSR